MKLKNKFENNYNFFSTMATAITDFSLWSENVGEYMDIFYFNNHSGEKPCSPLLENWSGNLEQIALMVYEKYKKNWQQAAEYLTADYDLYEDVEEEIRTVEEDSADKPSSWKTISTGLAADNQTEVNSSVYGYNSSTAVPDGKTESKTSSKMETEHTGVFSREHGLTETINRHGSSKLRTGAEMLELDNRFWSNWNFFELVFKNTDRELTCPYYD